MRETLFNWLGQDLSGRRCLDLFAGSGALGFEAASRGAARVVMVERDARVFRALEANARLLDAQAVELVRADGLEFAAAGGECYDAVFLDPPFDANVLSRLLPLLPPRLAPAALVYVESPVTLQLEPGWTMWRNGRAGHVNYHLLQWNPDE